MRNYNIDVLRIVFAITIVVYHTFAFNKGFITFGYLGVEFFFIVSGYMLMSKKNEKCYSPLINVVKKLLPLMIASTIIALVLYLTIVGNNEPFYYIFNSMLDAFGLMLTGIHTTQLNVVLWYVSALIISYLILCPIVKKYRDNEIFTKYISLLIAILLIGYLSHKYTLFGLTSPRQWDVVCYVGLLRGFADICLGIFIYSVIQKIKSIDLNKKGRNILAIIEFAIFGVAIFIMCADAKITNFIFTGKDTTTMYDMATIELLCFILIIVGLIITFSEKSALKINYSPSVEHICMIFSYLSVLLFLNHVVLCYNIIPKICADCTLLEKYMTLVILIIICMIACHFLSKIIIKLYRYLVSKVIANNQSNIRKF